MIMQESGQINFLFSSLFGMNSSMWYWTSLTVISHRSLQRSYFPASFSFSTSWGATFKDTRHFIWPFGWLFHSNNSILITLFTNSTDTLGWKVWFHSCSITLTGSLSIQNVKTKYLPMFISLSFSFNTVLAEEGSEEEALRIFFFLQWIHREG